MAFLIQTTLPFNEVYYNERASRQGRGEAWRQEGESVRQKSMGVENSHYDEAWRERGRQASLIVRIKERNRESDGESLHRRNGGGSLGTSSRAAFTSGPNPTKKSSTSPPEEPPANPWN